MSTLTGLTLIVGALLAILVYAMWRFRAATRRTREAPVAEGGAAIVSDAVQEAVSRLREEGREMRARAEASERLSDHVIGSMRSGLLLVEASGDVRIANRAARQLLGLPVAGGSYQRVLERAPALRDLLATSLRDAQPVVRRTIQVPDDRRGLMHIGLSISPVTAADGCLQSVICLFDDVTETLALENRLRLQDSFARVGELTAGIAHEFRNGLATIHGYARLMDPERLPDPYPEYLAGIRAETAALGEVVANFLNFARPVPLTLAVVDVRAILERAADDVRAAVEGAGGVIEMAGEFGEIEGDEVLLRQAFSNLCRNAWEACESTGRPARISLVGRRDGDGGCRIRIADNGPGIAPSTADRIFQPFFTTRAAGTGLGLALVQKIIVTHNGQVSVSNGDGTGAVVDVVLPWRQSDRAVQAGA